MYNVNLSNDTLIEKHHICPKSKDLFPEYKSFKSFPWNCIPLTLRQHYIAHMLLWKAYRGRQTQAFVLMSKRNKFTNSKIYENARMEMSSNMAGDKNPNHSGSCSKKGWENSSQDQEEDWSEEDLTIESLEI